MKLTLTPHARFGHGQVSSYAVTLPDGTVAICDLVGGRGWHLTIRVDGRPSIDRGLFATTFDILSLLAAEHRLPPPVFSAQAGATSGLLEQTRFARTPGDRQDAAAPSRRPPRPTRSSDTS